MWETLDIMPIAIFVAMDYIAPPLWTFQVMCW